VPSLKPNRLRGVACARLVDDVRPKPSCDQRMEARPNAMRDRLRMACSDDPQVAVHGHLGVVAARLDAEVAARGPRHERLAREARQVHEGGGPAVGDAEAVDALHGSEERRAEPERDGEAGGRQVERLARVVRRGVVGAVDRAERARGSARRHARGRRAPVLQERDEAGAVDVGDVEGGEVQAVLGGRRDAGLVRAVEGVRGSARGLARAREGAVGQDAARGSHEAAAERARAEEAEDPAAGDAAGRRGAGRPGRPARRRVLGVRVVVVVRHQPTSVPVSCDSGSASAFTPSARPFTWSVVSSS
jgi:hypothetical protein